MYCKKCETIVLSHAEEGSEPQICGICAVKLMLCPWCLLPVTKAVFGFRCQLDDSNFGVDENGVIY